MSENFFILLPFIQYPDNIPKNVRDAVEKASIFLYIYDELRKPTLLHRKAESLKSFVKFLYPYCFYRQGTRLFIFTPYNISTVKFMLPIYPEFIENFKEGSFDEFQKQLADMMNSIKEVKEEEVILKYFLSKNMLTELENLLFSPDSKLTHIINLPSYKPPFQNHNYQTIFEEMIQIYNQYKNKLNAIITYLNEYPENILQKPINSYITQFSKQKSQIIEKYKDIIEPLTQEINIKIHKLEEIKQFKDNENKKKYSEILKDFIQNQPELLKTKFSEVLKDWPIYSDSPENLMKDLNYKIIAIQKNYDEFVAQYKKIENDFNKIKNEESENSQAIDKEFLNGKNELLQRIKNVENERDKKIEEINSLEQKMNTQITNIKNLIKEKQTYVEKKLLEFQKFAINIIGLEFISQIAENTSLFLTLPYYIVVIEDSMKSIEINIKLPQIKTAINKELRKSGSNPDLKDGHIWFNTVSDYLLSSVKMLQPKIDNDLIIQQISNDLKERNFLFDSQVEADIYNGLEYLYKYSHYFRLSQLNDLKKVHAKVIEAFEPLHKLILQQKEK